MAHAAPDKCKVTDGQIDVECCTSCLHCTAQAHSTVLLKFISQYEARLTMALQLQSHRLEMPVHMSAAVCTSHDKHDQTVALVLISSSQTATSLLHVKPSAMTG